MAKGDCDIIAVSAGFDRHEQDWGGMLRTGDYLTIGKMIREFAERSATENYTPFWRADTTTWFWERV